MVLKNRIPVKGRLPLAQSDVWSQLETEFRHLVERCGGKEFVPHREEGRSPVQDLSDNDRQKNPHEKQTEELLRPSPVDIREHYRKVGRWPDAEEYSIRNGCRSSKTWNGDTKEKWPVYKGHCSVATVPPHTQLPLQQQK